MAKKEKIQKTKFSISSSPSREEKDTQNNTEKKKSGYRKYYLTAGIFFGLLLILFSVSFGYAKIYENKVPPKIYLEGINVGGMSESEFSLFIKKINNNLASGLKL